MTVRLTFEIKLRSDYHVGSGHGLGTVDSALLRDGDGVPVLRGSMIAGLLRDGLWRLLQQGPLRDDRRCRASGLGEDAPPYCLRTDTCPLCRIFGTPAQPKRWQITSARPTEAETPGMPKTGEVELEGHVVQRVRINPRTRRAEPRKLFSRETGQALWRFRFQAVCDASDDDVANEAALLVAAARAVRGLGRARRRGQGECRLELVNVEGLAAPAQGDTLTARWLAVFKTQWLDGKTVVVPKPGQQAVPDITPTGDPVRLRVFVRADEPLLLAQRSEAGNEFETVGVIPGTALLGALAGRAAARYDLEGDPNARQAFVQTFLRGRVVFPALLPAYYQDWAVRPAVPAPLDLLTCKVYPGFKHKSDAHGAVGYARGDRDPHGCQTCREEHNTDTPLRHLGGFVTIHERPQHFKLVRCHEMHIAIEPVSGRVNPGDLYGYVSLEPGQYFLGELVCADETAWAALRQMANLPDPGELFRLHVGKATGRGHGRVSVVMERVSADAVDPWRGLPLADRVQDTSAPLVLTSLTDAIVPDPWGRFRVGFDKVWLEELLGAPVKIERAFAQARVVDGFFGHLGLPRFRDLALVAGSAVGFRFAGSPPADLLDRLAAIEHDGVGLRREEGYGQVAFNHPLYDGCVGVPDMTLDLPGQLRPGEPPRNAQVASIVDFRREWDETLGKSDKVWKNCRHLNFDAVARILRHGAGGPLDDLKQRLEKLGRPGNLLEQELKGPRKENFFTADGKAGRDGILQLLDELATEVGRHPAALTAQLRRLGVEMLADQVAAAVDRKEQGR
jgi:CRISPR-associated protein Csx10